MFLAAWLLGAIAAPPRAQADDYTVYTCKKPGGNAGRDGWAHLTVGAENVAASYCSGGGSWILFMRGIREHAAGELNEAVFTAPSGTTISGYDIWRNVRIMKSTAFDYSYALMEGQRERVVEDCHGNRGCYARGISAPPFDPRNKVSRRGLSGVGRIWLSLGCRSTTPCGKLATDSPAKLWIHGATIMLDDSSNPVFASPPSGTLLAPAPLAGVEQVSVSASDRGSGVYQAIAEIDGRVVARQTLDANGGRCQPPYTYVVPCKLSASGTLGVDTRLVPDGQHLLRLLVTDATGTNSAAWGPVRITTSNGSCQPVPRDRSLLMRAAILRRRGKRPVLARSATLRSGRGVSLVARLTTPTGAPVAGAPVCVATRARAEGAPLRSKAALVTDAMGRVAYRLRPGPSRIVYFVYRTASGAVARAVRVNTRASLRLRGSRKSLRNGEALLLHGRLKTGPVPRGGVIVELQARRESGWQTFGTTRSGRRGRFSFAYTFTRTSGVQTYSLRARVPSQSTYPYAAGASKPIRVRVSG